MQLHLHSTSTFIVTLWTSAVTDKTDSPVPPPPPPIYLVSYALNKQIKWSHTSMQTGTHMTG